MRNNHSVNFVCIMHSGKVQTLKKILKNPIFQSIKLLDSSNLKSLSMATSDETQHSQL